MMNNERSYQWGGREKSIKLLGKRRIRGLVERSIHLTRFLIKYGLYFMGKIIRFNEFVLYICRKAYKCHFYIYRVQSYKFINARVIRICGHNNNTNISKISIT